ncbi:hypothetical protein L1987_22094 [Smallanthus sonchifolius]|uniref:Uncharacterized protein n=1 Tax=Smallanthus sonchifolius TaxID=185202 RepID=A0ACB9ID69_9ASTR|nr:hypothetical protein L1987_22094 [Smallanthus sonchifolius]
MDSLLASYASSDEDEPQQSPPKQNQPTQSQPSSKFGGSFFSSLPPPQQTLTTPNHSSSNPIQFPQTQSRSLFAKLPQPKSERSDPFSLNPKPKKIVRFRPPVPSKVVDDDDEEDDGEKEVIKKDNSIPQAPSVKSFLSSIPAPRNSGSLGALPSAAGAGRRSILEAEVSGLSNSNVVKETVNKSGDNQVKYDANVAATTADYASYDYSSYEQYQNVGTDHSSYGPAAPGSYDHANYSGYEGYSDYGNYGQYESKWIDRSGGDFEPEISVAAAVQSVARPSGKRGRNEIPQEVIEVNQDELMKNRPREDQAKLTGIAFGPAYQPTSSAKGKPSKLHKRKHQIGSLYFDMRSKEMELAERRSKGFLTKAETQAKYGW